MTACPAQPRACHYGSAGKTRARIVTQKLLTIFFTTPRESARPTPRRFGFVLTCGSPSPDVEAAISTARDDLIAHLQLRLAEAQREIAGPRRLNVDVAEAKL